MDKKSFSLFTVFFNGILELYFTEEMFSVHKEMLSWSRSTAHPWKLLQSNRNFKNNKKKGTSRWAVNVPGKPENKHPVAGINLRTVSMLHLLVNSNQTSRFYGAILISFVQHSTYHLSSIVLIFMEAAILEKAIMPTIKLHLTPKYIWLLNAVHNVYNSKKSAVWKTEDHFFTFF